MSVFCQPTRSGKSGKKAQCWQSPRLLRAAQPGTSTMNISPFLFLSRALSRVLAGSMLVAGAVLAFAQVAPTGAITGRVYNPASQEYVRNAEVRLDGSER